MKITIYPSQVKGTLQAPASKSSMQRACAAALLKKGRTILRGAGQSNDEQAALAVIKALGAKVTEQGEDLLIESNGVNPVSNTLDCGESGLAIRMFTSIAALSNQQLTITGSGSLRERPMDFFVEVFPKLGVNIISQGGRLPLQVRGPISPVDISVDGSISSQFLTGLLLAYAAASAEPGFSNAVITVSDLKSKPYIDLTLDVMKAFGMNLPSYDEQLTRFSFEPATNASAPDEVVYDVEGDWSNAAFLLVAGAIAGPVIIHGLDLTSAQADRAVLDALMAANAAVAIEAKGIRIHRTKMDGFYFDATDCPDLFPPLVALAAYCNGKTTLKGVSRLVHKESNRALTLQDEFDQMGVFIEIEDDLMHIHGGAVKGADVSASNDHRIAMALAVAALRANSETVIDGADAVRKSYPGFFRDLEKIGVRTSKLKIDVSNFE